MPLRAYGKDLIDFALFLGASSTADAARVLLASGPGAANELALRYKSHLLVRGLATATVSRRLVPRPH